MKHNILLTTTSLISVLLLSLHLADDIVRGFEKGRVANLAAIPLMALWLYGALALAGRRSGYVIAFLFSLLGAFVPYVHFSGAHGVAGGRVAGTSGALLFVWTLLAIGASSVFSLVLAAQGWWKLQFGRSRDPKED